MPLFLSRACSSCHSVALALRDALLLRLCNWCCEQYRTVMLFVKVTLFSVLLLWLVNTGSCWGYMFSWGAGFMPMYLSATGTVVILLWLFTPQDADRDPVLEVCKSYLRSHSWHAMHWSWSWLLRLGSRYVYPSACFRASSPLAVGCMKYSVIPAEHPSLASKLPMGAGRWQADENMA